ncbi:MAG: L17 family ribosomal protein [Candidatus Hodgkinia cicadicola]
MHKLNRVSLALIKAFVVYNRVVSITQRLKRAKPKLEALISLAKRNDNRSNLIRLVRARLKCSAEFATRVLLMAKLYSKVSSGFTRLLKLGKRRGDGAHMSLMLPSVHLPLAYCG